MTCHLSRMGLCGVLLLITGCGPGGSPPLPDQPDTREVAERRIIDLALRAGDAVIYQNWHMLASLHGTDNPPAPESLAARFKDVLESAGPVSHVVEVARLEDGTRSVTVGTAPDSNTPDIRGITITFAPEEASGHYIVRELSLAPAP